MVNPLAPRAMTRTKDPTAGTKPAAHNDTLISTLKRRSTIG
jgi:hypothetical protein